MIKLTINGQAQEVDVAGDTPLLWVLRDALGMTGTKYGCGMALCGACTVHIDGAPTRACVTPVESVAGKAITTIGGCRPIAVIRCNKPGWRSMCPSAVTASPGRSCRRRRCLRRIPHPRTPISMRQWPATSAVAAPIRAFVAPSIALRNSPARRAADMSSEPKTSLIEASDASFTRRGFIKTAAAHFGRPRHRTVSARVQQARRDRTQRRTGQTHYRKCVASHRHGRLDRRALR